MKKVITLLAGLFVLLFAALPLVGWLEEQDTLLTQQMEQVEAQLRALEAGKLTTQEKLVAFERDIEAEKERTQALTERLDAARARVEEYEGLLYTSTAEGEALDPTFAHYRSLLSTKQQELYDYLRVCIQQSRYEVDVTRFEMNLDQIAEAFFGLLNDDPSLFWMDGHVTGYGYNLEKIETIELRTEYTLSEIEHAIDEFHRFADPVVQAAAKLDTELEQIRHIHDHLAATVDYTYGQNVYTADSAIVRKQAVCEGYAKAFVYFMNQLGIQSVYCTGSAGGETHGWNLVQLDGAYYNVDITWDDPIGLPEGEWRYDYFLKSDAALAESHTRDEESLRLPACTSRLYDAESWVEAEAQAG